ncbi:MAG: excinuclease ABC subunit UvrA [Alphaproteobacteria bacterium]|nr:excinuclease ABC subunit UvrA [Alphaproteobacteria bacterium]
MSEPSHITVRGAREHNLRNIDVAVPRNALVVFTGVSGSGKSSLVYDTIHQEGQRRFMESLSAYARQFLGRMERPAVEAVDGVSPTVSIDQKTVNRNPRSTVGTITEIYDHMRLLMARLGTPHCPHCGTEVRKLGVDQVVDRVLEQLADQRVMVLGPVVQERKGEYRKELADLAGDGWVRARIDGAMVELSEPPELARYEKHTIEVVVDRLVVGRDRPRLSEAIEVASGLGKGVVTVVSVPRDEGEPPVELVFSTERACPSHPEASVPELEPRLFSFNAPQGACPTCNGLGALEDFEVHKVVDLAKRADEAFLPFNDEGRLPFTHFDRKTLNRVVGFLGGKTAEPLAKWPADRLERLVLGDESVTYVTDIDRGNGRVEKRERPWRGLMGLVRNVWHWTKLPSLEAFRSRTTCPDCQGRRLSPAALAVTFREVDISVLVSMTVERARAWFDALQLEGSEAEIGQELVNEIRERLGFLEEVGLGYLGLDRTANTLSGGESQRIRLASQVGSALQGVTYILDEPSIGLHPRDNRRLLTAIQRLRDRGNSVLVVEHDAETMLAADWVVDIGPGAGSEGGHLVAAGPPAEVARGPGITAEWLRGDRRIAIPARRAKSRSALKIVGANANNLRDVSVSFPLGRLVCITGVSGSGKSTLVFEVLENAVRARLAGGRIEGCEKLVGGKEIDKVIEISQTPIGRTPRSNPATYTKLFDPIRELFAKTPEARARGWKKGRFSFNVPGGRCEACEGAGVTVVEMQFLPSVEVPCEVCEGKRFNAETLQILWKGLDIYDVLNLPVSEAVGVFRKQPKIHRILETMDRVGLGYVALGQPSTTLSGGEAQRVKLATELHRPGTGNTLYLLDEPTTGLHFEDVARLVDALQALVDAGNSVVVVEHHTDIIKVADHLIDLGPEGGSKGGQIVGEGAPEALAKLDTPTGRVLREVLSEVLPVAAEAAPPTYAATVQAHALEVRGARRHNLQGVDVSIGHGSFTVITGPSGSGKTSLAFDTIFSEGQRRYVESLSTYARRFLGRLDRAPVTSIEGLQPAIAIDQRASARNPRSTVATVTEIHDVLRLLYARIGLPHCPHCGRELHGHSASEAAGDLQDHVSGAGWMCAALPPTDDPGLRQKSLVASGWTRLLRGGEQLDLDGSQALAALEAGCFLVVDRLDPAKATRTRVAEAFEKAYELGQGEATFVLRAGGERVYAGLPKCPDHGRIHVSALTPRHFSFNSQLGACSACDGLGMTRQIVVDRLFTDRHQGFWESLDSRVASVLARSSRNRALVAAVLERFDLPETAPVDAWSESVWEAVLDGLPEPLLLKWTKKWGQVVQHVEEEREWPGLRAILDRWTSQLAWLTADQVCRTCRGGRLKPELLAVTLGGQGIHAFLERTVEGARDAAEAWELDGARRTIAERPLLELRRRLGFLVDVGLGYLTLDRSAESLSGGEAQRIRLASQLGSGLVGCTYVLDEPTIGLHPRDTSRLLDTLFGLRDLGNTVVVVEHDTETIARADRIVDMGPAAGVHGGQVMAVGTPAEVRADPASLTGRWLSGVERMPAKKKVRKPRAWMTLKRPAGNNLHIDQVRFPTGVWLAVSGVSGSGKSTLVMDTLAPALQASLGQEIFAAKHDGLTLGEDVDRVVVIDQSPIGRTPRSTPATYCKVLDPLRKLFAEVPGSRERGWTATRFSWNSPQGGRCEVCEGRGSILIEMHFLPDVWVTCESCHGKRFGRETLEVRFKGKNIADVLSMRIDEALELFANQRNLERQLQALVDVGLGYLTLGQPATTLSGGEAQRVKLAAELTSRKGHCVYVLDEPTTGLHLSDVAKLVAVLEKLVDKGHTVITIEHHVDVLRRADWLLDLGPEGGAAGGRIVAEGTPAAVMKGDTATAQALRA